MINCYQNSKFCLIIKGSCLEQKNATFILPNRINVFIVFELNTCSRDINTDLTLKDCLIGGVKLSKNDDPGKYVYIGYGIGYDLLSEFSFSDGSTGKNVIIFGVNMSSSVHINNKEKDILIILGVGPTQGLHDTVLTAKARYSVNFSRLHRTFCLNLHYIGSNSFLFVNATKIYQFKTRDSEMKIFQPIT